MTTILSADHLSYRVGHATILADLSLAIEAGRRTAIIGPNGAGKSTLLRLLAGLARPAAGQVLLRGEISASSSGRRSRAGSPYCRRASRRRPT